MLKSAKARRCLQSGMPWVDVHVIDNGSGILPEEQPYIFERFFEVSIRRELFGDLVLA